MNINDITNKMISIAVLIITFVVVFMLITVSHGSITSSVDSNLRDENSFLGDAWVQVGAGTGANAGKKGMAPITVGILAMIAFFGLIISAAMYLKKIKN